MINITIDYGPIWFWLLYYLIVALIVLLVVAINSKGRK